MALETTLEAKMKVEIERQVVTVRERWFEVGLEITIQAQMKLEARRVVKMKLEIEREIARR